MKHPVRHSLFATGCFFLFACLLLLPFSLAGQTTDAAAEMTHGKVLVVKVHGDIESGVSFFIQRMLRRA